MEEELSEIIEKVAKIKIDEMKGNSKSKTIIRTGVLAQ